MRYIFPILLILIITSCRPEVYTPKPRGYYRVDLPARQYQRFNDPTFPYSFEYPAYSRIARDTSFSGAKQETPYWINIDFPSLGGRIYLSYKIINEANALDKLIQDAYTMTVTVHNKRADNIEEYTFHNDSTHVHGLFYNVSGNAASAYQFYATDSVKHFIRGALYFDVSPNADSLKPVNEFLKTDIQHILRTLNWK
jgi:gliding motility-associated lipoprotein GldD